MTRAYKFAAQVGPDGKLEVQVPVPPGTPVEVLVLTPDADEFHDLLQAAESSTGFWDNPMDDEDWSNSYEGGYCNNYGSLYGPVLLAFFACPASAPQ